MAQNFTTNFAFDLGDLVAHRTLNPSGEMQLFHRPSEEPIRPTQFMVVERFVQQCEGGIQNLYLLRTERVRTDYVKEGELRTWAQAQAAYTQDVRAAEAAADARRARNRPSDELC